MTTLPYFHSMTKQRYPHKLFLVSTTHYCTAVQQLCDSSSMELLVVSFWCGKHSRSTALLVLYSTRKQAKNIQNRMSLPLSLYHICLYYGVFDTRYVAYMKEYS